MQAFGFNLALPENKPQRMMFGIIIDEAKQLNEITECNMLEELVIEVGENPEEFSEVLQDVLINNPKKDDMI